jgi:hypothetical protein
LKVAGSVGRVRAVSDGAKQTPAVNGSQVMAAGFAAAAAAFFTSRFGVAGTLLGAALTAMIITGGSAILRAYLETLTGNVRKVPRKIRARREQRKAERYAEPETLQERPDLRDNFAGRMRAALDWFSHLPPLTRHSILVKGLIAAAVAFVIGMGAVFVVERGIGNSLSCGLWANCPEGATPGIHLSGDRDAGARSTLSFGRARTEAAPTYEGRDPAYQQNGLQQDGLQQNGLQQNGLQQNGLQQNRSYEQQQAPDYQRPTPSDDEPARGLLQPDQPVEEDPVQPEPPSSASPVPEEASPPAQRDIPSRASPAPSQ